MKAGTYWRATAGLVGALSLASLTLPVHAQTIDEAQVLKRLNSLEAEIQQLKQQLADAKEQAAKSEAKADKAEKHADRALEKIDPVRPVTWKISGYADTGLKVGDNSAPDGFNSARFAPIFHFQYKDLLLLESELEITTASNGETSVDMEYTQLDFLLHDNAVLVVGRFLSPFGQFVERIHPTWINKMPNMPVGYGHGGISPISETGIMLRGGIPLGADHRIAYSVAVGNGPRFGEEGLELEGTASDDNSNKAISGRLGFFVTPELELGGSLLTAKVTPEGGVDPERQLTMWGMDGAYTKGAWDVRAELISADLKAANGTGDRALNWQAWYAQAAYRLSGISDSAFVQNLEPVVRYGRYRLHGDRTMAEELNEKRFDVGLNYWLAASVVVKAALEHRNFEAADRQDDTRFLLQFAYGF